MQKKFVQLKNQFMRSFNPAIRFLILSDIFMVGSTGLLGPVFALYIKDFINGGNETIAGISMAIYLLTRSLFQIPVATIIDKIKGEKDDFYFMFLASLFLSLIPLGYLFIDQAWQLYVIEFLLGLSTAFTYPSFMAIFTRHIDKGKEGVEWGVYFTLTDLFNGFTAAIGGFMATIFGFQYVIIFTSVFSFLGAFFLWPIRYLIKDLK